MAKAAVLVVLVCAGDASELSGWPIGPARWQVLVLLQYLQRRLRDGDIFAN